eukprot:Sdes_comp20323_c0_seq2m13998
MLLFCPNCSNLLTVADSGGVFKFCCECCPYVHCIQSIVEEKIYMKMKELDDVLGGAEAWENVDSTDGKQASFFVFGSLNFSQPFLLFSLQPNAQNVKAQRRFL